ncbi:MAG: peptide ABC transporter ATP-binding protein [Epulopiscium sp. Nele67-Bin004]|nr:MAG: peptide ABC transporter ATP-binding protein [Epulopiscium sp. Nele67-Bin004]
MIMMDIKNITKIYSMTKRKEVVACKDVSFPVYKGEFLSIIGESGSGKSTIAKILSNLETPATGQIIYNGKDVTSLKDKELRLHRKELQLLFQDTSTSLNPKMTIENIICEPLLNFKIIKKAEKKQVATEFLEKVGLDATYLDKRPHQMSGGQRQRVSIARALTLSPNVLVLDEPTSALDVITEAKILDLIKNIQKEIGVTIIFICHDLALVTKISDRIVVMQNGNVVEVVNPHQICERDVMPYTQTLIDSTFDSDKCRCKFSVAN